MCDNNDIAQARVELERPTRLWRIPSAQGWASCKHERLASASSTSTDEAPKRSEMALSTRRAEIEGGGSLPGQGRGRGSLILEIMGSSHRAEMGLGFGSWGEGPGPRAQGLRPL